MTAMSDTLENKLIDALLRGQAYTMPATTYIGLMTALEADAAGGTEVSGNAYARVSVTSSLANWAGTQGAASTTVSSGTSGTTSNNGVLTFPTPTPSGWGTVVGIGIFDAATGGNLLLYGALASSLVINAGTPPTFAAGALSFQIDN